MIISLKKGTAIALSPFPIADFLISNHLKKINNKNAMLQIKVNLDKKIIKRISPVSYQWGFEKQYSKNYPKLKHLQAIYYHNH